MTMKKNPPRPNIPAGLRCPRCGCRALPVYYTRSQDNHILRIRHCSQCSRRLLTRERVE
jgi:transcriptional regulator NrdR family protein